jgi:hypothetical protein
MRIQFVLYDNKFNSDTLAGVTLLLLEKGRG